MTILCVSFVSFSSNRGTPCHLMRALAKRAKVVFVNPVHSLQRWRKQKSLGAPPSNLTVLTPVLPTTFRFLSRSLRRQLVARWAIPPLVKKLQSVLNTPVVLWTYLSELALPLTQFLKPSLVCYHCLDDFSSLIPEDRPLESLIEGRADILFAVSPALQERYAQEGRSSFLLPNGVDIEHFSSALSDRVSAPLDLASLPSPRIGFVGTIDPLWVDLQLLDQLAGLRPEWSIILIGPLSKQMSQRDLPSRLIYLGSRPYSALPGYLKGLDVCLIPFRDNRISRSASPLKLYEYLAAGREVVTTPVPDPGPLSPYVRMAERGPDFVRAIEEALPMAGDPKACWRKVEAVREHSWDRRAELALQEIQKALEARERDSPLL